MQNAPKGKLLFVIKIEFLSFFEWFYIMLCCAVVVSDTNGLTGSLFFYVDLLILVMDHQTRYYSEPLKLRTTFLDLHFLTKMLESNIFSSIIYLLTFYLFDDIDKISKSLMRIILQHQKQF